VRNVLSPKSNPAILPVSNLISSELTVSTTTTINSSPNGVRLIVRVLKVLTGSVKQRLDVLIHDVARELDCEVLTLAIEPEHLHLFINSPPDIAPSKLMHRIKGRTARFLRKEFPELMKLPSMWTRAPVCIYGW